MNPSFNNELPTPIRPESAPADSGEVQPTAEATPTVPTSPSAVAQTTAVIAPPAPQPTTPAAPVATATLGSPAIADDADLIEKEWVQKAKQIVEHTKNDPYIQGQQMNRLKSDYMKKRYNKDVKLEEAA